MYIYIYIYVYVYVVGQDACDMFPARDSYEGLSFVKETL